MPYRRTRFSRTTPSQQVPPSSLPCSAGSSTARSSLSAVPPTPTRRPHGVALCRLLLLCCTWLVVVAAAPARAASLTVTSTADDGSAGTLRAQIAAASAGDTINFDFNLSGTITLTQG